MKKIFSIFSLIILMDMDILLPPGDPFDSITNFQPMITVTDELRIIQTGGGNLADKEEGGQQTGPLPKKPPADKKKMTPPPANIPAPPINYDFISECGITTKDFSSHHPWIEGVLLESDPVASAISHTSYSDSEQTLLESNLKCFNRMLLKYFHSNRTFDNEEIFSLLLLGLPSSNLVITIKEFQDKLREFFKMATAYMGVAEEVPNFLNLGDPYSTMISRIISSELTKSYPFTLTSRFAYGLSLFPERDLYLHVRRLISDPSKRVRRNAVYYLGTIQKYDPMQDLFEVLKNSKDAIERARALYFLTMSGFQELPQFLTDKVRNEPDTVFQIAFINSLAKLSHKKAFGILVEMLDDARTTGDFEKVLVLMKASLKCFDKDSSDPAKKFVDMCNEMKKNILKLKWIIDSPAPKFENPADSYVPNAKLKILRQLLEMSLALSGEKTSMKKYMEKLETAKYILSKSKRSYLQKPSPIRNARPVRYALSDFEPSVRILLIETLPGLGKYGKAFLEQLLLSAFEDDQVLFAALFTYFRNYPDSFPELSMTVLNDLSLPVHLIDRVIRYIKMLDIKNEKIINVIDSKLKKISELYLSENADEQHLAALAIFYLGTSGQLSDPQLVEMANKTMLKSLAGIPSSNSSNQIPSSEQKQQLVKAALGSTTHIMETIIELFINRSSPEIEKYILAQLRNSAVIKEKCGIHTYRALVKVLSNFESLEVKKILLNFLADPDPWTRLIAYMSLNKITGKEHRVDWFYSSLNELQKEAEKYKEKIFN
ncbi:MAG: hypothetical protein HY606_01340 [Planctomycetes bacterium]|nr:hypothetical protein [Planctomycetota bacterium]